jgi:D-alanyl-D-alanine carboxypeptidase
VTIGSRRRVALCCALAACLPAGSAVPPAVAGARPPVSEGRLQRGLDAVVAAGVPGAVFLLRDGARTLGLVSGRADVERRTPMRVGDRFRVGSVTKPFVATVVLQLAGAGTLALEDPVERWLPGMLPNGAAITVRQLLNHTSGLFDFAADPGFVAQAVRDPLRDWPPSEIVAVATATRPHSRPAKAGRTRTRTTSCSG